MLKRCLALAVASLLTTTHASAQDEDKDAMRRPERLTVGIADQFLGQASPDGKTLYFASNRNTTNEIYEQNIADGRSHIMFDEGAEVTWPRVSPDGKSILYVSYSDRATGLLCIRDLPKSDNRRCLENEGAALLAEWIDGKRLVAVTRGSIAGDLRVVEVTVGSSGLKTRTILERNVTSPTVSPDGKWLVYVPLERSSKSVGPAFAAHAGEYLEAVPLDHPGQPIKVDPDLPGLTGQPTFAKDGKSVYFVQFFSDSNHDGVVDASDHGVIFRAPLTVDANGALTVGIPKQITDESWNCQYPAPAASQIIMTCSHGRNLDLYSLPLDGEIPPDWASERLALEVELASSEAKLQLLHYERLLHAKDIVARRLLMVRLVRTHLSLEEYDAAQFWAKHIAALGDPDSLVISAPMLTLIDHRRAVRDRARGRMVESFDERAEQRIAALVLDPKDSPAEAALERIVRSEIADSIGDKAGAKKELEAAPVAGKTPRTILEAYYERSDAFYREVDDREGLVEACRKLALHPDLAVDDRLRYARASIRAMVRGLPYKEAEARLEKERAAAPADSEMAFAIDLGRAVLAIRSDKPAAAVRDALVTLYERENRVDRRRAIMLDAVERANQFNADSVIEHLAEHYVDSVAKGTQERRRAERLYSQVIIGRAFRRRAADRLPEARADFEAVAKRTGSLEAIVAALDLRLRAGEDPKKLREDYQVAPLSHFVDAYLVSRQLPNLEGPVHEQAVARAIAALMASWSELKNQCMAQSLYGAILHEEFLRTNNRDAAERASTHYLVALELVADNARYKAMVLGQLGLLHTQVGNYRIGLGYLKDRDKLPYAENTEGFAVRLAEARDLLHIGKEKEAATEADVALKMLDQAPKMVAFRILALDRAALYNLAADRFPRALALYDEELALLDKDQTPVGRRNRFVVRLAHAAAALGAEHPERALADVDEVEKGLNDATWSVGLTWPHATNEAVLRTYRLMTAGLRAQASQRLGQLDAASKSLAARKDLLEAGLKASDARGECVLMLTLVEAQLADNAMARHDDADAKAAIASALEHADTLHDRAAGTIDKAQLDVLWLAAAMKAQNGDVPKRLGEAYDAMIKQNAIGRRTYERWFEIYLTLTGPIAPP